MDIAFLITTCNRKESCQRLVDALAGLGDIYVMKDGNHYDISGATQSHFRHRMGREGYWKVVNWLFAMRTAHKYYIMLPDDFMPAKDMVKEAIRIWEGIDDPNKICLNLLTDRVGQTCWTNFKPIDKGSTYLTQWVDMCFLCEEKFFWALGKLPEVSVMFRGTHSSSGVGRYISKYLSKLGYNLYQVKESLVIPQAEHGTSQMHDKYGVK